MFKGKSNGLPEETEAHCYSRPWWKGVPLPGKRRRGPPSGPAHWAALWDHECHPRSECCLQSEKHAVKDLPCGAHDLQVWSEWDYMYRGRVYTYIPPCLSPKVCLWVLEVSDGQNSTRFTYESKWGSIDWIGRNLFRFYSSEHFFWWRRSSWDLFALIWNIVFYFSD